MLKRGQGHGDAPVEGFYLMARVRGGPLCAVSLRFGPACDPDTGAVLDRSPLWHATLNGEPVEVDSVWPWCARKPVDKAEHDYRLALAKHAETHGGAEASPRTKVDLMKESTPW